MSGKIFTPCDPNAQQCVRNVLKYLSDITCEKVLTGQHTQTMAMEELHRIEDATGKLPALLGFELLSYSPNINYLDTDAECMTEVEENFGTLKRAWEWADKKGLITFTWHWFSPLGGRSKSFFTENTDFDASQAVIIGTPENAALLADLDVMAGLLRPFRDRKIPILWRPFHECDGTWFWWGAKGADTAKELYRLMFERFTKVHRLGNLIWVWNAADGSFYPGDDCVDVISRDMYPEKHSHTSCAEMYHELVKVTDAKKPVIIGETGTLPDVAAVCRENIGWASYMTWSKEFCLSEEYTDSDTLRRVYSDPHAVTLDKLPELY
ncbi:mannan endo-1,4-beta-mannosidase [Ruminococcus sp. YE71]|uniref:glycosyl hydrolase n=1 Tax=unclassified Ruminococcus TaxID=2608920 RepID=UPI0008859C70|nr:MULTISPECIES: glycosyl hydrolase [unclassified Ruminococcus]SDA13772.1 mannan endo-1,4-beta-mannosidase [Ruminococcus sp. YE78]SFW19666.1 mannan endo-1,4-beta-mannosidase [Ruminococcus sp. YE71]